MARRGERGKSIFIVATIAHTLTSTLHPARRLARPGIAARDK